MFPMSFTTTVLSVIRRLLDHQVAGKDERGRLRVSRFPSRSPRGSRTATSHERRCRRELCRWCDGVHVVLCSRTTEDVKRSCAGDLRKARRSQSGCLHEPTLRDPIARVDEALLQRVALGKLIVGLETRRCEIGHHLWFAFAPGNVIRLPVAGFSDTVDRPRALA